ncbi:PAS domain-containing protein [Halobaculum sp. MBLA0147]|uniref:PAS domain-containing protein n=1 Tax=Halobaculum sp. MBLA0147 TaxID=3079934 RepID=UPI0035231803
MTGEGPPGSTLRDDTGETALSLPPDHGPRPALRDALRDLLVADPDEFRERVRSLAARHEFPVAERLDTVPHPTPEETPSEAPPDRLPFDTGRLAPREVSLAWKVWVLDEAPLGVTLAGPAYHDTPLVAVNETFCRLTGYDAETLHGENPRLLQTDATAEEAVADFVEALRTWEGVTVELHNERRDGTPFRNRVSLVPVPGADGTVENWFGLQAAVAWPEGRPTRSTE